MIRFVLRRTLVAIPILLGVATIVFVVLSVAPGDPSALYFSPGMSPESLARIRENMGLNDPLLVRYGRWLLAFLQGDFGYSLSANVPVRHRILAALPNTFVLAVGALALSFIGGILIGVVQAMRQHSFLDSSLSVLALFFYSMPSFWLAIMLILVFSVWAQDLAGGLLSLPPSGITSSGYQLMGPWGRVLDRARHLVLPTLSLTLVLAGGIARYVRTSMLEVLEQDYIRTARAKGLSEARVVLKHAFRNALIPVVTLFGLYFPFLLSGAVFVEYVFAWPGMGKLMVDSFLQRDYPVALAGTFLFGAMVVLGNLIADILYGIVDPRVRQEGWDG